MIISQKKIIKECFAASPTKEVTLWLLKERENPLIKINKEDAREIVRNFPELAEIQVKKGINMGIYAGLKVETVSVVNFPALEVTFVDEKKFGCSALFTTIFIEGEESIREFFEELVHG